MVPTMPMGHIRNDLHANVDKLIKERLARKKPWMLKCLPYAYLFGVVKSGTTDLVNKMYKHPDIVKTPVKSSHWWELYRHGTKGIV